MAWNEPGSGNRDPWNQNNNGKGGNHQGPPDLDEVFNKLKARFSGKGGKGGGGRPDMAQAGGPDAARADEALAAVRAALGG